MIAYWFSRFDGTTEYQTVPARIGRTDTVDGTPVPCWRGLHASPTPWDALQYARGGMMMWEVRLDGAIVEHGNPVDKYAAQRRTYLRKVDLTRICYMFAAEQALSVIDKWDAPAVVREYLTDTARGLDRSDIRPDAFDAAKAAAASAVLYVTRATANAAASAVLYVTRATANAAVSTAGDAASDAAIRVAFNVAEATYPKDYYGEVAAYTVAGKRFNELAMEALEGKQ